jgi:hypothetical protein
LELFVFQAQPGVFFQLLRIQGVVPFGFFLKGPVLPRKVTDLFEVFNLQGILVRAGGYLIDRFLKFSDFVLEGYLLLEEVRKPVSDP